MEEDKSFKERLITRESIRIQNQTEEELPPEQRFSAFIKGCYSEFFGTFLFLLPILGACANAAQQEWPSTFTVMALAFITGMNAVACISCFSALSGAQFNPAITFALWVTRKISNRKCICYILLQLLASILVMGCIYGSFPGVGDDILKKVAVQAPDNATTGNIFFTEFLMSFLLVFVCFAMAFEEAESASSTSATTVKTVQDSDSIIMYSSTPQSRSGFAPFAIGFVLIAIVFYGGGSGVGLNPARMFGPALFANVWDDFFIYMLGQFLGAAAAGILVVYGPQSTKRHAPLIHNLNVVPKEVTKTLNFIGNTIKDGVTGHHHNQQPEL